MSATTIIDTAPLGALIRYTDGCPKPPARFTKKLAAWERSNGVGRLVKKEPPRVYPTWTAPASFTLHEGNAQAGEIGFLTALEEPFALTGQNRYTKTLLFKPKSVVKDQARRSTGNGLGNSDHDMRLRHGSMLPSFFLILQGLMREKG